MVSTRPQPINRIVTRMEKENPLMRSCFFEWLNISNTPNIIAWNLLLTCQFHWVERRRVKKEGAWVLEKWYHHFSNTHAPSFLARLRSTKWNCQASRIWFTIWKFSTHKLEQMCYNLTGWIDQTPIWFTLAVSHLNNWKNDVGWPVSNLLPDPKMATKKNQNMWPNVAKCC